MIRTVRTILITLLLIGAVKAQPSISLMPITPPRPVRPGDTVRVGVVLSSNVLDGSVAVALNFYLVSTPPVTLKFTSMVPNLTAYCAGTLKCILVDDKNPPQPLMEGGIAFIEYTAPSTAVTLSVDASFLNAVDKTGSSVALSVSGGPVTIVPISPCDLNQDGKTDAADVLTFFGMFVNAVQGIGACTADLDGNGVCDSVDAQRIVTAATGGVCRVGL